MRVICLYNLKESAEKLLEQMELNKRVGYKIYTGINNFLKYQQTSIRKYNGIKRPYQKATMQHSSIKKKVNKPKKQKTKPQTLL